MSKSKKKKLPIKINAPSTRSIDFEKEKVVSFSQYSTYAQCPHKWYLQNVKKIKQPPNINMVFGTAMHATLQHYLRVMYETSGANADREDLEAYFEESYKNEFKNQLEVNKKVHFTNPEEMSEYFEDGLLILDWFKKHRREYFSTKGTYLVGIEMPVQKEVKPGIIFTGYIDLVIYDEILDKIIIYDIKTSTKGWNKWAKDDFNKQMQIILYKSYFSELYNFPIEKIDVEFLILKRKVESNEFREFPKRIQTFKPANGKIKINEANSKFQAFIDDAFTDKTEFKKNITKLCNYCLFNNTENCQKP